MGVACEIVAQRIGTVLFYDGERVNDVPERLRHLLPAACNESVIDALLRGRQSGRNEHRLPHDGLKAYLVFTRHLYGIRRLWSSPKLREVLPALGPTECGNIVRERVEPHVHGLRVIIRHCDTPRHFVLDAGNAEILEPAFYERYCFLPTPLGCYNSLTGKIREQLFLIRAKAEEVILLFYVERLHRRVIRAHTVHEVRLFYKSLIAHAVQSFVRLFIDVTVLRAPAPHLLRRRLMIRVGRADEMQSIVQTKLLFQTPELGRVFVDVILRILSLLRGLAIDLEPVLVGTSIKKHVVAL